MPFSSSPDLDDGNGIEEGTPLQFGGRTQDAQRQAQLEALQQQTQSEAVAAQQRAVEEDLRRREAETWALEEERRVLFEKRQAERNRQQTFACFIVIVGVFLALLSMAHRGLTTSSTD